MKKFIAMLLALTLCLGLFAGCQGETQATIPTGAPATVKDAKDYLYAMYKDSAVNVLRDFSRVGVVAIDGVSYTVTWTTDASEENVKIVVEDKMVTIDINEKPAADYTFTLTATIADKDGKTETVTFTHSVTAPATTGTVWVDAPEVGVPYKWALQQNALKEPATLYFTGEKSGNYLATSTNPLDAVDVIIEETEGGYHMYFMDGETKMYINITTYDDNGTAKKTQDIGTEPTCVYTWDAERKTMVTEIEALGDKFYLGTYNTYTTISTSATSFIEDVSVIGVKQFPAGFCTINAAVVEQPETGKAYIFGLQQNLLEPPATLYFTGNKSGNYLETSKNIGDAVRVYLEETEGGYHLVFLKDGVKMYINITTYVNSEGTTKNTQDIGTEPTCVYTWDAERKTMVADLGELGKFYLGTYNTYNTISSSATSFIEDVSVIGVKQFPCGFYDLGLPVEEMPGEGGGNEEVDPPAPEAQLPTVTAPVAGTAYKFGMIQVNLGKTLYLTGEVSGKYLVTTENKAEAVDVYVEAAGEQLAFYFMDGEAKKYIAIVLGEDGKQAMAITDTACGFSFNAELCCWYTNLGGTDYYVGSYSEFETMSASKTSYIKADNTGITQFPAGFFEA